MTELIFTIIFLGIACAILAVWLTKAFTRTKPNQTDELNPPEARYPPKPPPPPAPPPKKEITLNRNAKLTASHYSEPGKVEQYRDSGLIDGLLLYTLMSGTTCDHDTSSDSSHSDSGYDGSSDSFDCGGAD